MQIHVARHSSQIGVFTVEEVTAGLQSGRFLLTDLAWREGLPIWSPLGTWDEFRSVLPPPLSSSASSSDAPSEAMPAWERGISLGNFFATIRDVALNPVRTFDALPVGGYARPISFAYATSLPVWILLTLGFGVLALVLGSTGFQSMNNSPDFPTFLRGISPLILGLGMSVLIAILVLLAPLFHFINAAIIHLLLLPWGGRGGFEQTYRASSYVQSAFTPLQLIPCVNYVAIVWQVVVLVIAMSRVHAIEWWKVGLSLLVVPCCCFCALYGVFFAALTARMH